MIVNVRDTQNVLAAAVAEDIASVVLASSTSLMISNQVKATEASEGVWFAPSDEVDASRKIGPRNKYGGSKLAAETMCQSFGEAHPGLVVIVLRTSRFFPKDLLEKKESSLSNIKANDLLGRRVSLEDVVQGHSRSSARTTSIDFGAVALSAPWRFPDMPGDLGPEEIARTVMQLEPRAEAVFSVLGWSMKPRISRVDTDHIGYICSNGIVWSSFSASVPTCRSDGGAVTS